MTLMILGMLAAAQALTDTFGAAATSSPILKLLSNEAVVPYSRALS